MKVTARQVMNHDVVKMRSPEAMAFAKPFLVDLFKPLWGQIKARPSGSGFLAPIRSKIP